jgi:hypothetical protein
MPAANVIQLQSLLSEKFPGLRQSLGRQAALKNHFWPTGLSQLDEPLCGGLPKGALSEIVGPGNGSGSATLIRYLLSHAAGEKRIVALIDGSDALEVTQIDDSVLERLLWIRCRTADEALKAADLILRDNNLPLVLIDLKLNPEKQLRKIPATTWYRFQYLVEKASSVCAVFTPQPMVAPAKARLVLRSQFSLASLDREAVDLLRELEVDASESRRLQSTA